MKLSLQDLQKAVLDRMVQMHSTGSEMHKAHCRGVIRGIVWAWTGVEPSRAADAEFFCKAVGLQYRDFEDHYHYQLPGLDLDEGCQYCKEKKA